MLGGRGKGTSCASLSSMLRYSQSSSKWPRILISTGDAPGRIRTDDDMASDSLLTSIRPLWILRSSRDLQISLSWGTKAWPR